MIISEVKPDIDYKLKIKFDNGKEGTFDVYPYLIYEAFSELKNDSEFKKIQNGGYFVEWDCGADLSADTIEANLQD
ncbi:DUF2442 domain-containing protein [Thiospirochaeta perfilievii]|uniref:DUF2442 domain-containing protein n=1 Tax=Thiospirochaeta perfilievii TaxID=252967 RepID=A0A5C1Q7L7_9SPIO|nr:DUF2442 domain-containing protein [Thiospirochaeta perfilievii]QEN03308.1 DUF2442 domain-containing protein [Thiospirochaeta perfilievii]